MNKENTLAKLFHAGCFLLTLVGTVAQAEKSPVASNVSRDDYIPLKEVSLGIERTRCLGTCTVYRVSISGFGRVEYEGLDHVDAIGVHESEVSVDDVVKLVNQFLKVRSFESPEEYASQELAKLEGEKLVRLRSFVTDRPSTILRLRLGKKSKEVVLYHNFPVEYEELANEIDRVAGTAQWVHGDK
jgi:hypothetical protein